LVSLDSDSCTLAGFVLKNYGNATTVNLQPFACRHLDH